MPIVIFILYTLKLRLESFSGKKLYIITWEFNKTTTSIFPLTSEVLLLSTDQLLKFDFEIQLVLTRD